MEVQGEYGDMWVQVSGRGDGVGMWGEHEGIESHAQLLLCLVCANPS